MEAVEWRDPFPTPFHERRTTGQEERHIRAEMRGDGVTGVLADAVGLRSAIAGLLADADLRRRLGGAAREAAVRSYTWPAVVEATSEAYALFPH